MTRSADHFCFMGTALLTRFMLTVGTSNKKFVNNGKEIL